MTIQINNLNMSAQSTRTLYQAGDPERERRITVRRKITGPARVAALGGVLWAGLLPAGPAGAQGTPPVDPAEVREAIRVEIELLRDPEILSTGGVDIAAADLIAEIYERRGFEPAWSRPAKVDSLLAAVDAAYDDGLDPADYHRSDIEQAVAAMAAGEPVTSKELAVFDLTLTDSVIRLAYHERFGKVNPEKLDPVWNFGRSLKGADAAGIIEGVLQAGNVGSAIRDLFPRVPMYNRLKDQLRRYRDIAAEGGWPMLPAGPTLRPGATDERVPQLAARLRAAGDLPRDYLPADPEAYDDTLQAALRQFQERHGLEQDAVVGKATVEALNVTVERRIDQLRLNLERARWVTGELDPDFVLVNIAGFAAYLVRDGEVAWSTKVVVGRTVTKTPVFRATMQYVVFNPDWTVPRTIATKEILPAVREDPDYLARGHYELRDPEGHAVDPATVDWSTVTARNFRFTIVQLPGPWNALGRVKFMFPNEHDIYLHDTPSRSLFERAERAFSHGCIRLQDPLGFAEQLLGPEGWTRQRIDAEIASGKTRTVFLPERLPVLLLYWTAEVDDDGHIHFYKDIYDRDPAILEALAQPFELDEPS